MEVSASKTAPKLLTAGKCLVGSLRIILFAKMLVYIPKYNVGWIIFSITFEFSVQ